MQLYSMFIGFDCCVIARSDDAVKVRYWWSEVVDAEVCVMLIEIQMLFEVTVSSPPSLLPSSLLSSVSSFLTSSLCFPLRRLSNSRSFRCLNLNPPALPS